MDQLGALGAFVQTAETGSFVAAARKLGLGASAVGKAVARLEARLQVQLFHRQHAEDGIDAGGTPVPGALPADIRGD
jgi:DNA-binding transcriptional LysR family regulator